MAQINRTHQGGRIDRKKPLRFQFNGKEYTGYSGDTLASALLANGLSIVARSWKYHRPRGIIGDGAEEPNALMQVGKGNKTIPNVRATQAELYDGMIAESVNAWPSVNFDLLSITGIFSRMLPPGFYYKTFMWPKNMWEKYEGFIRKASGLGYSPEEADPDTYLKTHAHCDVLVVGAGPSGLMAALTAGLSGARVILADEQNEFGGRLLSSSEIIDDVSAASWVEGVLVQLRQMDNVTLLTRSTVFGYHDYNFLTIAERLTDHLSEGERKGAREKLWRVRAKQVVLATGAHERPLVFGNNDLPGVMLASAVATYALRYGVKPGSKAVVFTNNDSAYQAAFELNKVGVELVAVVDARQTPCNDVREKLEAEGIPLITQSVVCEAKGRKQLRAVKIMGLDEEGDVKGIERTIDCDLLAVSGGWSPVIHLYAQSGSKAVWSEGKTCFVPGDHKQATFSVGSANGAFALDECFDEGREAGFKAAISSGMTNLTRPQLPKIKSIEQSTILPLWVVPSIHKPGRGPKQFVDPQNDVAAADIDLAAREGFHSIEHVKRYTALGFGTDQGKVGNINGMAILAKSLGKDISATGTTTFRPNYTPVSFATLAGPDIGSEFFDPVRKTAIHAWHEEQGALFENVGQWKRPWYYPKPGESMQDAVNRECLATRNSVGIIDASTLGKIEITGEDASEFLNRIYTNAWKKLGIDRARYGFMLGEDGMVLDDGVTVRLAEHKYFMHTTTGNAATVLSWMERWLQTEWPELKVFLTSVTDQWSTAAVVGPNSRKVVSAICQDIDFSAQAFPFMSSRTGTFAGVAGRVNRISFSGELAYEVNVPANYGQHVWQALMAAGKQYDITPYGTETMHVLRAEKGYVIVGQDTDGSVTPIDLGMKWVVSDKKDFLGRRSLYRSDTLREDRKQLVGLLTENPKDVIPEGAQIVADPEAALPMPMEGHVSSSYFSANLGCSIAMALVKGGLQRMGESVYIPLASGKTIKAEITASVFIDPKGERQNV